MSTVVHSICIFAIISIKATKETSGPVAALLLGRSQGVAGQGRARQGRGAASVKQRSKQFSSAEPLVRLASTLSLSHSFSVWRRPAAFGEYNFLVPDVTMNTH